MRLRNKKTGEIKDVESLGHEKSLRDKYGPQITLSWNTEYENLGECRTYNSLAELNEEWEDYKEPKEYWYIDCYGMVIRSLVNDNEWDERRKEIGNYFETKEEAEKAVEKLKAWKRLKDKGLEFDGWILPDRRIGLSLPASFFPCKGRIDKKTEKDLDLLFGGEK